MPTPFPGEVFALLAAFAWACALVMFKYSGERVPPIALNLFKNAVSIVLLVLTLLAAPLLGGLFADETFEHVCRFTPVDILILVFSGVVGIALADTLFFYSLNIVGVGIVAIVECAYSPVVIVLSALLIFEQLSILDYLGAVLVLTGVFISSRHKPPPNTTRGQIAAGVLLGALAMGAMGFGIVLAKPLLERFPLIWASAIRLAAGTLALVPVALASPARARLWSVFRPSAAWKTSVPGAFLGTYLAYVFWVAGFKYADASIAAILNQTSTVFSIILATIVVREPLTRRKLIAIGFAVAGVVVVLFEDFRRVLWGAAVSIAN